MRLGIVKLKLSSKHVPTALISRKRCDHELTDEEREYIKCQQR